jgi:hypothetical protein
MNLKSDFIESGSFQKICIVSYSLALQYSKNFAKLYDMTIFSQLASVVRFFIYIVLWGEVVNLTSNPQPDRQGLLFICPLPFNL